MNESSSIREPAVAGQFYPASPRELGDMIARLMAGATSARREPTRAIMAPHAGYIYSGPTAAAAYAALDPDQRWRRVVVLGPAHRVPVAGIAVPSVAAFSTPLGALTLDQATIGELLAMDGVVESDAAHALEHSIEVQLPFLQVLFGDPLLIPLVVGEAPPRLVASVIERLDRPGTLIVASSDLSHFLPYDQAQVVDHDTLEQVAALATDLRGDQACGCRVLNGLARYAGARGWQTRVIDYRNSGDTAGDRRRVVGYGAVAYAAPS